LKNLCGDGIVWETEECDYTEGCSDECWPMDGYSCSIVDWISICESVCGDGIRIKKYEGCDDGNIINGDGCSDDCLYMESDFNCYSKVDYHSELPSELLNFEYDTFCEKKSKDIESMSKTSTAFT